MYQAVVMPAVAEPYEAFFPICFWEVQGMVQLDWIYYM